MFRRRPWAVIAALALAATCALSTDAAARSPHRATIVEGHQATHESSVPRRLSCAAPTLVCVGGAIGGAVVGITGSVVGSGASAAATSAMSGVVSWAADGAAWLVREIAVQIERSTRPDLESDWYMRRYSGMVALAGSLAALFLLLAVGEAIAARDISRLIRSTFLSLPYALVLTFAAITLVQIGLAVTDWMTTWVLDGSGGELREAFHALATGLTASGPQIAPFALFLSSIVISLLALLVWLELVMREATVYVGVAFLPLALVAMVWERSQHWIRRLAEWLVAIILAKFTIAVAFTLAASAIVEAPASGGGVSALLAGASVLLVAALTPWALLRMLPFAEAAAGRTLSRGGVREAATSAPGVGTATAATRLLLIQNLGGAGVARASAISTPSLGPTRPGTFGRDPGTSGPALPELPRSAPTGQGR
jgi:hypothetical protein